MFLSVFFLSRIFARDRRLRVQHVRLPGPWRWRALATPPESRIRHRGNTRMRVPFRGTRFAALLMICFAILCGTTAALVSHRDRVADRAIGMVAAAETAGSGLEGFPTARALAAAVVDALETRTGGGAFRVVDEDVSDDALSSEWLRYRSNAQHDRARVGPPRQSFAREPNHAHGSLPPQLQCIVHMYVCGYCTLIAGILAFLVIVTVARWWRRDQRTGPSTDLDMPGD
jgi:hypothetical protein